MVSVIKVIVPPGSIVMFVVIKLKSWTITLITDTIYTNGKLWRRRIKLHVNDFKVLVL